MARQPVLEVTPAGIYCPAGDFYIDPWQKVERAVITHGHSDHTRWGMGSYLCSRTSAPILRARLEPGAAIQSVEFGEWLSIGSAKVSLHPAGHILGSAQIRVEVDGEIWVVSGDYKTEADRTAEPFEPIRCHGFITETTFGLPIYRWKPQHDILSAIDDWWRENQVRNRASVIFAYSLGKAQRILGGVDSSIGPILIHGSLARINAAYAEAGLKLPETKTVVEMERGAKFGNALVIAPPSANGTPWMRRFGDISTAFASGWMAVRGARRRRAVDRGFVLSDHVDWPSLMEAIQATGAETVWTTHGYAPQVARYLVEQGLNAKALETRFVGEAGDAAEEDEAVDPAQNGSPGEESLFSEADDA
jgi:putative mRNA 3-end processing factor